MGDLSGKELLDRLLSSTIKIEILILFRKNPNLIDSLEGIASRIEHSSSEVTPEVEDLVRLGIISKVSRDDAEVYLLDPEEDRKIQKAISEYIKEL